VCLAGLAAALRLVVLDSDPYPRLTWSSALLTDEGFYIHNARNLVLFGKARTDGFNNMLIMPTLHALQVLVFRLLGVGAVQARLISALASLLTLPLFFATLRRVFDTKIALVGTLFLGLDHTNLLYSRLALMDTPAAALLICCMYALVRGLPRARYPGAADAAAVCRARNGELLWMFTCGALLGRSTSSRLSPGWW
jgi:4-amino-4-deoxy-L-arabinose transferase-like glycosyltransferase